MSYLSSKRPLVLVADAARARFFSLDSETGSLIETETLVNGEARLHARDLTSDREGRTFSRRGGARHAKAPSTDAKTQNAERFAHEVADRVSQFGESHSFDQIVLIAEPQFLGLLRKRLHPPTKKLVSCEIDKDFTTSAPAHIETIVIRELRGY